MRRRSSAHLKINTDVRSDVEVARNDKDKAIPPVVNQRCEIEEEINQGRYECGICCDENIKRGDQIWYCHTCWSVYHHDWITRVALATTREFDLVDQSSLEWNCPTCRAEYVGEPLELCFKSEP